MHDAIYDIISAGVPHRVCETAIEEADLPALGLAKGRTVPLGAAAGRAMRHRFGFATSAETGPAVRISVELACRGLQVGILDLSAKSAVINLPPRGSNGAGCDFAGSVTELNTIHACRFLFTTPDRALSAAFHYGAVKDEDCRQSALKVRAAKLFCIEDRLWDVEGGARFAAMAVDMARNAGRTVVLLCKDADCVFRNRREMRALAESGIAVVAGEAQALLLLLDFQRLDSLIPKLRGLGCGAVIWRENHPPLVFDREVLDLPANGNIPTAQAFWDEVLPLWIAGLSRRGSLRCRRVGDG